MGRQVTHWSYLGEIAPLSLTEPPPTPGLRRKEPTKGRWPAEWQERSAKADGRKKEILEAGAGNVNQRVRQDSLRHDGRNPKLERGGGKVVVKFTIPGTLPVRSLVAEEGA